MFAFSETNKIILNCALQKKVIKKLKMKSGHGLVWGFVWVSLFRNKTIFNANF